MRRLQPFRSGRRKPVARNARERQTSVIARILWSAPGRPSFPCLLLVSPRGAERRQTRRGANPPVGGWRNTPDGTSYERPVPPMRSGGTRLPALHLRRSATRTGRAFENVDQPRLSASSWRRVLMPGSGAPPSPGCFRVTFPESPRRRIDRRPGFPVAPTR